MFERVVKVNPIAGVELGLVNPPIWIFIVSVPTEFEPKNEEIVTIFKSTEQVWVLMLPETVKIKAEQIVAELAAVIWDEY